MATTENLAEIGEKIEKAAGGEEKQYLTFQLGTEELGINILKIKEIISYSPVTRIPMSPKYILGVMNVRGNVVPVVDLGPRFGRLSSDISRLTCIIIVEIGSDEDSANDIGIVVDSVEDVIGINANQIEPPPSFGSKIPVDYIYGMGKVDERFIMLLNIENVLDVNDLADFEANLTLSSAFMSNHPAQEQSSEKAPSPAAGSREGGEAAIEPGESSAN